MPQVAPNYRVIGADNRTEKGGEAGAEGARTYSEGSSGGNSEEEEEEIEEEELEPCFMGRAEQQRKAMRRAMSECTHLSVPTGLEPPDKYPGGDGAGSDQLASRRPPHSMKRSLTVAEDQPPTPPPTLSAAGATQIDLRRAPPEPRLSPFPPPKEGKAGSPLPPLEGFQAEKEPGGIVLPVPLSTKGFGSAAPSEGSDHEGETGTRCDAATFDDSGAGSGLTAAGGSGGFGLNPRTNPFVTVDGRWRSPPSAVRKSLNLFSPSSHAQL